MEDKRVIYDKVAISIRALSILIVFGLFMTALVIGYGYFMGNSGGGVIPVGASREQESATEVFEQQNTPIERAETEMLDEGGNY